VVARELGVRYVVRGAVRRDGERVRLDLAMVDGESGAQRWAEQIDVERARLAQSIDDLKGGIAKTLVIEVGRSVGERVARLQAEQVEADDLAMQGFFVFLRGVARENFLEAREIFERAVVKDPNSIRGLAGVSLTNSFGVIMHWMPDREASVRRSEETLAKLESIDPNGHLTLMSQASVANMRGDWEGVLLVSKSLLELFPNDPTSHHHRCSALLRLGGFVDAIPSCQRAIRISPRDSRVPIWHGLMGMNYFMLGQYAPSAENLRIPVTKSPHIPGYWPVLIAALARDGRRQEAAQVLKDFTQRHPTFTSEEIAKRWYGTHPSFVEGRERVVASVRELGLP
jgi:tetratricopeptide (TPR) repeat protein